MKANPVNDYHVGQRVTGKQFDSGKFLDTGTRLEIASPLHKGETHPVARLIVTSHNLQTWTGEIYWIEGVPELIAHPGGAVRTGMVKIGNHPPGFYLEPKDVVNLFVFLQVAMPLVSKQGFIPALSEWAKRTHDAINDYSISQVKK